MSMSMSCARVCTCVCACVCARVCVVGVGPLSLLTVCNQRDGLRILPVHLPALMWNFKSIADQWRAKPMMYVSELVGHEGPGSVLHMLREKQWATGLAAGNSGDGSEASSRHCLFQVSGVS